MTTLSRTAGAAGSFDFTTKNSAGQLITPASAPTVTWYTDSGRTLGSVSLTVAGSGSSYTASWSAGQAPASPATRYLKVHIEVSTGVFDDDVDDDISFVDAVATVGTTDYTTLPVLKASLGIDLADTDDDDALERAITAASRAIDRYTGTTFYPVTEARYYDPTSPVEVWVDRFASTSGLTVQVGVDGTYPTTVDSTDVIAWPYNAPSKGRAYCRLLVPSAQLPCGYLRPSVKVTAQWGFADVPDDVEEACRLKAAKLYRRKDSPEGVAGSGEFGVVRISKFEDPDVVMLLNDFTSIGVV